MLLICVMVITSISSVYAKDKEDTKAVYPLTIAECEGGKIQVKGQKKQTEYYFSAGDQIELEIQAEKGYVIKEIQTDDIKEKIDVSNASEIKIFMASHSVHLIPIFEKISNEESKENSQETGDMDQEPPKDLEADEKREQQMKQILKEIGVGFAEQSDTATFQLSRVAGERINTGAIKTNIGNTLTLNVGTYYVKELKAPKGYALDTQIKKITVASGTTTTVSFADQPQMDTIDLLVRKVDADTDKSKPQGNATLKGAEFTVKFYDGNYTTDPAEAGKNPLRTWVFKTDQDGVCRYDTKYQVSGDDLYMTLKGNAAMPLGTITIQETKAPEGYLINSKIYVEQITSKGIQESVDTYNQPNVPDNVLKLELVKRQEGAEITIPKAVFEHTEPNGNKVGNEGWNDIADYEIGQNVPYKYESTMPNANGYDTYYYAWHDKMDEALTFDKNSVSIKIYADGSESSKSYTLKANEFTVNTNPGNGESFIIAVNDMKAIIDREFDNFNALKENTYGQKIVLTYQAKLNDRAAADTGRPGFENDVRLEFSNNPDHDSEGSTGYTPWDTVVCFTYKLNVYKTNNHGVDYSLKKDVASKETPKYLVFFKAKDVDVITAAFQEYAGVTLKKKEKRASVHKKLENAKMVVKNRARKEKQRIRQKIKHREQSR